MNTSDGIDKDWNPMIKDFRDANINSYDTGPGANLDWPLQAAFDKPGGIPYLVFVNVPHTLSKKSLYNLASRYGRVLAVRNSSKNALHFMDLASVADMLSILRNLENNPYGFKVVIGRPKAKENETTNESVDKTAEDNSKKLHSFPEKLPLIPSKSINRFSDVNKPSSSVNLKKSNFEICAKNFVPKQNFLGSDQNRYFWIETDQYTTNGISAIPGDLMLSLNEMNLNGNIAYRTGRSYQTMPEELERDKQLGMKYREGSYNVPLDVYQYIPNMSCANAKNAAIKKCNQCSSSCNMMCSRCQTSYCNVECQKQDWQEHRYTCGKPSNFIFPNAIRNPKSPAKGINLTAEPEPKPKISQFEIAMPKSGTQVIVSCISQTNIVFIRSNSPKENCEYYKAIAQIHEIGCKTQKSFTHAPRAGTIVLAKFADAWNRAMIIGIDLQENIQVVFIDYGNLDKLKLSDLIEAPEELATMPRLMRPVILRDVPNIAMTDMIRHFLNLLLLDNKLCVKYNGAKDFVTEKSVYRVDLLEVDSGININEEIMQFCIPTIPKNDMEVYMSTYLRQAPLPVTGHNVELMVMDNSTLYTGYISLTTRGYARAITDMQLVVQRYGDSLPKQAYAPRISELCIVRGKEDGKWLRGRCMELFGDGSPSILFIDYGNIERIKIENIRRYPRAFTYPILTVDCLIEGLSKYWSPDMVDYVKKYVPIGKTIICQNVFFDETEQGYSIFLPDLTAQLQSKGMLPLIQF